MNQHYQFWVSYYEGLEQNANPSFKEKNEDLETRQWKRGSEVIPFQEEPYTTLQFKVTYPGLLIGLGETHDSGSTPTDDENSDVTEIRNGFSLDSVTGLPVLPGSSVKGILRSAFIRSPEYIAELLGGDWTAEQIKKLEVRIFGKQHPYDESEYKQDGAAGEDIFFDAYPVKADSGNHLLGIDYITPHRAENPEMDGLKNPIPIKIMKVLPDVIFLFRFRLYDTEVDGKTLSAAKKKYLFRDILEDMGTGAKTNVGYGALAALNREEEKSCKYLVDFTEQAAQLSKSQNRENDKHSNLKVLDESTDKGYVEYINLKKKQATIVINPPKGYPRIKPKNLQKIIMPKGKLKVGDLVNIQYDEQKKCWRIK